MTARGVIRISRGEMKKVSFLCICFLLGLVLSHADVCRAAQWKDDFERLCGSTEEAPSLPADKVRALMEETDTLLKTIEGLDLPDKKVYLFRLKKCRNFFGYILELKATDRPSDPIPR